MFSLAARRTIVTDSRGDHPSGRAAYQRLEVKSRQAMDNLVAGNTRFRLPPRIGRMGMPLSTRQFDQREIAYTLRSAAIFRMTEEDLATFDYNIGVVRQRR